MPVEAFPEPASQPNPTEVPTSPTPVEDPAPTPDVVDPGVGAPSAPDVTPGGPTTVPSTLTL